MDTEYPDLKDWRLSDEALYLLWDFKTSPDYYRRWLLYLNDMLIVAVNEDMKHRSPDELECMYALKHIRDLLEALQEENSNG